MIRFLLRFIGLCLLALAFVFFVYDGTKSIANQHLVYARAAEAWALVDQSSLNAAQNWLKQKAAWAWDPYMHAAFELPAWVILTILAMILIVLGRKKKPLIGYARN
jgi:chromate transport protein ChrA